MKLNCDLGESFGSWTMGLDEKVMPHIDQANIACGFHAGDPLVMQKTLALAKENNVSVGAHPGYSDLVGFGRRSINCSTEELIALVMYQVAAIDGVAKSIGIELEYVKPHGALYNDMMVKKEVRDAILCALSRYHRPLKLMLQATPKIEEHRAEAKQYNIDILSEAFADRCYDDDGKLLARTKPGAVHNKEKMLAQVKQLKEQGCVTSVSGNILTLNADSLCVHGDNIEGVQAIESIRELIG
ncbi:5-oxoprolinase subunit PxpA [Colwellia sp. 1_MG-2023]|uniref:5-oxoprolinase subunit PxpA n=1 Tax=unclassified Colwellia TaxID=196834 RepID=UPI001C098087|nr:MULTISPECIES: 5-oxoprolinase subunit PxpA [unclassified Colwellia]MBU2924803.1 5-oxoprolinase subunit PxpA [Colwellia sp. C2M11]MDO6653876.1 5-oxoprolinase subunit PxpA [Colwellia sp. 3_MG-2023]MDO6667107.1 5-oxoprolinase subunit PxpA [Colwellia sp. 2_MG-2023]MDO6691476.1 5-oxoprolinase subunit PxpA [Colwellia sp. 1_MG-2023]